MDDNDSTTLYDNATVTTTVTDQDASDNIRTSDLVTTVCYIVFGLLGVGGNGLVIFVTYKYTNLTKRLTNTLIIHQSVIDMIASFLLLMQLVSSRRYYNLHGFWGAALCRLWISMNPVWVIFSTSTYNLVALTLERYVAIIHPIRYKNSVRRSHICVMMGMVWLIGPLNNLHSILTSGVVDGRCYVMKFWTSQTVSRAVGILNIIVKYIIPLSLMIFCYSRMVIVLRSRVAPITTTTTATTTTTTTHIRGDTATSNIVRAKRNVIKTLIIVCCVFVFCWSWNQIYFLIFCLGYPIDFSGWFYHFTIVMVYANCCINPFVYIFKYGEFQQGLRQLFGMKTKGAAMQTQNNTTDT